MKKFPRISLEEAQELVLSHVSLLETEMVDVIEAAGRVAAKDLISDIDVAPFDHSAMDGFAFRASQIESATEDNPVKLKVIYEIGAGDTYDGDVADDECVRIMTGAPLPACCDSNQMWEKVDVVEGDGKPGSVVAFKAPVKVGNNIRYAGEDAKKGDPVVNAGDKITTGGIGYLASCGILEVETYRKPKCSIISTGSELVSPSEMPGPGQIRESNGHALAACILKAGGIPTIEPLVHDDLESIKAAILEATKHADFVMTSGGASGGDFDYIAAAVDSLGELMMTEVCMRPGKAQIFGIVNDTPVLGLAGNPAAAFCGFQMLIRPALLKMQGHTDVFRPHIKARLTQDIEKRVERRNFQRAMYVLDQKTGEATITPSKHQSSGLFCELQRNNALAIIMENAEPPKAGDIIDCILID